MPPTSPRLLALALAAPLAACVAGPAPEIATPQPTLPETFFYSPDSTSRAELGVLLPNSDPAFRELAGSALENAPSLAEALARIDVARAGAKRAGAERLPNVGVDGNVTGNRINPNQFGSNNPFAQQIDTEQVSYGANVTASLGRTRLRRTAVFS